LGSSRNFDKHAQSANILVTGRLYLMRPCITAVMYTRVCECVSVRRRWVDGSLHSRFRPKMWAGKRGEGVLIAIGASLWPA